MNRIILIGNLTKDPELSETSSGIAVCRFSLAVRRARPNAEGNHETDFFSCTAWRGLAETIERYVRKGDKLGVSAKCNSGSTRTIRARKRRRQTSSFRKSISAAGNAHRRAIRTEVGRIPERRIKHGRDPFCRKLRTIRTSRFEVTECERE